MPEPRHLDLVDRLRGHYRLPVNDGAGPLNGSMTFSRQFETPPIQKEAADEIEKLRRTLKQALSQWKMYSEMAEGDAGFSLNTEQSPEGELYRAALAILEPR